jgi:hypothetical protein
MKNIVLWALFCPVFLLAQEYEGKQFIGSQSGFNTVANTNIDISYSVGEVAVSVGGNGATEGFQQPETLGVRVATIDIGGESIDVSLSPNPIKNLLTLKLEGKTNTPLQCILSDIAGQKWASNSLQAGQSQIIIPMESMPNGMYLVQLFEQSGVFLKAFKVVKNQ